jgi:hypothetical protein
MVNRREIPGFYYDEERHRYFAIPSSSSVAEFNSKEIQNLDDKIKDNKRRKLREQKPVLSSHQQELINFKANQDKLYVEVKKIITFNKHCSHPQLQQILNQKWNGYCSERPFQLCEKIEFFELPDNVEDISGFRLCFDIRNPNKLESYMFYKNTPDGQNTIYYLQDQLFFNAADPVRSISDMTLHIHPGALLTDLPIEAYTLSRNGYNMCTYGDVPSNMDPDFWENLEYMATKDFVVKRSSDGSQFISCGSAEYIYRDSDITCIDYLDSITVCGYRNGKVEFFKAGNSILVIDFDGPICGLALIKYNGIYYCVISGLDNALRSYKLDFREKRSVLYMIYDDYRWSSRLSLNLKHDRKTVFIFGVETELVGDISRLELKFYSLFCCKPLRMFSGPFYISNTSSSELEWALDESMLYIYNKQYLSVSIYKTYKSLM